MIRGFYTARSGLMAHQSTMDIISNNMANVNTVGYKPMKASFTDLMYQNLNRETAPNTAQVGHGTKINKTDLIMVPGGYTPTNFAFDFAIEHEGFFAIQNPNGDIEYTRAGNFIMSNDGGTMYLAAANGDRVLDADGGEIELAFNDKGELDFNPAVIGVYQFPNPYGMVAVGNNRYGQTDVSGEPEVVETPKIRNGYLEGSAVELSMEMVRVIEASKAFSFNSKMLQVADEVEQTVNSLR